MILAILYLSQVLGTSPLNANVINEWEQTSLFQWSAWKLRYSNWRIVSLLPIIIEGPIEINYSYNPSQRNCFTSWRPASKNMKITKSKVNFVYTSFTPHPLLSLIILFVILFYTFYQPALCLKENRILIRLRNFP